MVLKANVTPINVIKILSMCDLVMTPGVRLNSPHNKESDTWGELKNYKEKKECITVTKRHKRWKGFGV